MEKWFVINKGADFEKAWKRVRNQPCHSASYPKP